MADIMSREKRSRLMGRIRGKGTTPERYVTELLRAGGAAFTTHIAQIPGKPDVTFEAEKVAVFIDGDYWHGWRFPVWQHRLAPFWRTKIQGNRQRDRRNHRKLRRLGWTVVRLWEHQVEADVLTCLRRIEAAVPRLRLAWPAVIARHAELPALKRRNRLPKP